MAKQGRPTKYNNKVASIICEKLAQGESLVAICRPDSMPSRVSVYAWLDAEVNSKELRDERGFLNRYTRARELQADSFFDDAIDIADHCEHDEVEVEGPNGKYTKPSHENIQRSRLRVDTRLKVAAITRPEKYSEKKIMELTGKAGGPIEHASTLSDDQLAAIAAGSSQGATGPKDGEKGAD